MPYENFYDLEDHLVQLFQNKNFEEALNIIAREGSKFTEERPVVDYWHMCAAARVKNYPLVIRIAENAFARGMWYGDGIWRKTPSFESLQGDPDFERIVMVSRTIQEEEAPINEPVLHIYLPANHSETSPLFVALHGNVTTAQKTMPFWQESILQGWVLALPQSNQVLFKGAYVWNDLEIALANVQEHFAQIQTRVPYDKKRVIIAGHSRGSLVAIQMSLAGILNVSGFIAIGPVIPYMDDQEKLAQLLVQGRERRLRGYLIVGEKDDISYIEGSQAFFEKLQSAGIESRLEVVPGATHDYSPLYDAAFLRALSYVGRCE